LQIVPGGGCRFVPLDDGDRGSSPGELIRDACADDARAGDDDAIAALALKCRRGNAGHRDPADPLQQSATMHRDGSLN